MATEAQKKAHAEFERRLKEAGGSKITVRLSPFGTRRMAELVTVHGSREKALEALLTTPQHPTPSTGSLIDGGKKKGAEASKGPERAKIAGPAKKAVQPQEKRPSVDVPLVGTFKRGPMQKGQPRGAKR
jgi:hypothetical protein